MSAIACPTCHKAFHTASGRDWHVNAAYCKPTGPALRPSVAPATVVARPRHKAARRTRRTSRHPVPEGPAPAPRAPYVPMTGGDRPTLGTIVDYSCPMPEGFRLDVPGVSRAVLAPTPELAMRSSRGRAYWHCEDCDRAYLRPIVSHAVYHVAPDTEAAAPTATGAYVRVGQLTAAEAAYCEAQYGRKREFRRVGLAAMTFDRRITRADRRPMVDPLATSPVPIIGWRAPERAPEDVTAEAPVREYVRLTPAERAASRRAAVRHKRPVWRMVHDPLASTQQPIGWTWTVLRVANAAVIHGATGAVYAVPASARLAA